MPERPPAPGRGLRVAGLRVRYPGGSRDALGGIAFAVAPGERVAVVGADGAGKSTLCRSLNGIVPHLVEAEVEGSVDVDGVEATVTPVRRMAAHVGAVLDEPRAQLSQATAGEEVALGLESAAMPPPAMQARVAECLAAVGLAGLADRAPATLSGGEQQRLLVAAVIARRPAVLVLDEPLAGLDPLGRAEILEVLAGLAARDATAVVLADHDVELLAAWADRVLVLADGRLVADAPPARLFGDRALLDAAGLRPPDVAAVAEAWAAGAGRARLPVTIEDALAWFGGRP